MRVVTAMGTRPEVIKMAPVIAELRGRGVNTRVVATAQHREMLDQMLEVFDITPDDDLDVMRTDQTPAEVLAMVLQRLQPVIRGFAPDWVLVQGDTTTTLAAAMAGAYAGVRVGHIEAGLRTYDRGNPFPEELNRVLVDHISDLCFAPTERARQALLKEGISEHAIRVTGNTVVDALHWIQQRLPERPAVDVPAGERVILVTVHRRENHGAPLRGILSALRRLAARRDIHIVYPVHLNPNVWEPVHAVLGDVPNVTLLEPVDYLTFVALMQSAYLILTDSGGIQEEAPTLGVPVLVLRSKTERPEAVEAGVAKVVGTDRDEVLAETTRLLDDPQAYQAMAQAVNPFGDGEAARRVVDALCDAAGRRGRGQERTRMVDRRRHSVHGQVLLRRRRGGEPPGTDGGVEPGRA